MLRLYWPDTIKALVPGKARIPQNPAAPGFSQCYGDAFVSAYGSRSRSLHRAFGPLLSKIKPAAFGKAIGDPDACHDIRHASSGFPADSLPRHRFRLRRIAVPSQPDREREAGTIVGTWL